MCQLLSQPRYPWHLNENAFWMMEENSAMTVRSLGKICLPLVTKHAILYFETLGLTFPICEVGLQPLRSQVQ